MVHFSIMIGGRGVALIVAVVVLAFSGTANAADPSLDAHGSVEQVYVTGLAPGAALSLLDSGGQVVASRAANDLGGALFRNVTPGDGYRVTSGGETSGPLTVLDTRPA